MNLVSRLFTLMFIILSAYTPLHAQVKKVEVVNSGDFWSLLRDGEPYYVKGAGGQVNLDLVVSCGGNSIRTWSYEGAEKILDDAHERGLTVTLGLWLGHERHGFDYDDVWAVKGQLEGFRDVIEKYKNHPALLMWGVGNEMDLFYTNYKVWDAVEDIAQMIHELDPNHPTMVVTAGLDVSEVQLIQERAPSIDILGVNTYGDIYNVPKNMELFQWNKPYMVTEWGPNGHWEVAQTKWGVSIEQTSREKADTYAERYKIIETDKADCLGSYVFLWGQKQEYTNTWYGLFSEDNLYTEAIDELAKVWSGDYLDNRAPQLLSFELDGKTGYDNIVLGSGEMYNASAKVEDPNGDALNYKWEIVPESTDKKAGGDQEDKPESLDGLIQRINAGEVKFKAPKEKGAYRLFVYANDGTNICYANWPFLVE